tara:strand:- start:1377 stop:1517 length:141 start_codon:yes stop_codon:yes gene_type:complete
MKYAHYFKHLLIISTTPQPIGITIKVAGKKEARQLAAQHNATPWNF